MEINRYSQGISPYQGLHNLSSVKITKQNAASVQNNTENKNHPLIKLDKQQGVTECKTCASRTYVDKSEDPGVSFKAPGHISPEASASLVASHEQEHVSNENAKANSEGNKVVSQSVKLNVDKCPECGKMYVSGGVTTSTVRSETKSDMAYNYSNTNYINTKGNFVNVYV